MENKEPKKIKMTPEMAYKLFEDEKHRLEHVSEDLQKMEEALFELDKSIFAIKEVSESKEKEVFVNLGNGTYVNAKIEGDFYVLTPSSAFLKRTKDNTLKDLEVRKKNVASNVNNLRQAQRKSQENMNQLYKFLSFIEQKKREINKKE